MMRSNGWGRISGLFMVALALGAMSTAVGAQAPSATAQLQDAKGQIVGQAQLSQVPSGLMIRLTLTKAPAGVRAFHIHAIGKCDAPSFESAGGHFNPASVKHGLAEAAGAHAGDLPNLHVPASGQLETEILVKEVSLSGGRINVLDADGAALVLHASADDYKTDPAGNAGDRVACGVITK